MKKVVSVFLLILFIFVFSSCSVVANDIDTKYMRTAEDDGKFYIESNFLYIYRLDLNNKTFTKISSNADLAAAKALHWSMADELACDFFAGEHIWEIPQGYEGVVPYIEGCRLDDERSVIYARGQVIDNALVGYVQIYKDTWGIYGNYTIEKISHSILFSYDAMEDAFTVLDKIEEAVVVATHENTVIYWKNRAYYRYDIITKAEEKITEDKAYDAGIWQHSWACVLSNEQYCVIHLCKVSANEETEYMYVFDYATQTLCELSYMK